MPESMQVATQAPADRTALQAAVVQQIWAGPNLIRAASAEVYGIKERIAQAERALKRRRAQFEADVFFEEDPAAPGKKRFTNEGVRNAEVQKRLDEDEFGRRQSEELQSFQTVLAISEANLKYELDRFNAARAIAAMLGAVP